jgi:hypothetical protein
VSETRILNRQPRCKWISAATPRLNWNGDISSTSHGTRPSWLMRTVGSNSRDSSGRRHLQSGVSNEVTVDRTAAPFHQSRPHRHRHPKRISVCGSVWRKEKQGSMHSRGNSQQFPAITSPAPSAEGAANGGHSWSLQRTRTSSPVVSSSGGEWRNRPQPPGCCVGGLRQSCHRCGGVGPNMGNQCPLLPLSRASSEGVANQRARPHTPVQSFRSPHGCTFLGWPSIAGETLSPDGNTELNTPQGSGR